MSEREFEPGEGEWRSDARIPLTRFATSWLSALSHKGRGEEKRMLTASSRDYQTMPLPQSRHARA